MPPQVGQSGRQARGECLHFGWLVAVANQGFNFPQIRFQLPQFDVERVDFVCQNVDVERCRSTGCQTITFLVKLGQQCRPWTVPAEHGGDD